jgi:hypothetical protein
MLMQKTLTAKFGLIGLVGLGLTLAISSCEFDTREVFLSEGVAFNMPSGDAGDGDTRINGGGPALGVASSLGLSPESLDFGSSVVGFEAYRRVAVTNRGSAPLTQLAVTLAPETDASLAIAQNLCGTELAPGLSCDVRLRFFPTLSGPVSGVFNASSAEQSASIPLTAAGVEQGDLLLSPGEGSSADFGATPLGSPVEASYRVDNPLDVESGVITFALANPAFTLQPPAPGECQPGVTSLLGGESCTLRISFLPAERGPNEATLTANSANLGSISLSLRGQGLAPGAVALDRSSHDFGGTVLGSAGQFTLSVANGGDVPITLSSVALGAGTDTAFSITSSDCGAGTVLGGEAGLPACSVQLDFRPTGVDVAMGSLTVSAEGVPEQSVTLRGEGLLPGSLLIAPDANASGDFGQLIIGQSATRRFRVSNPGVEPSGAITPTGSGGFEPLPPSAAEDCVPGTTNLVNGSSCVVNVRLTSTTRGPIRGSLTVNSTLAGSTSLELRATALAQARLALDREQVDFGRVVRGDTVDGTVTVRNTGDVDMAAPLVSLGTPTSGQATAFQFETTCSGSIAPGDDCSVALRFSPRQATAHSVTLNFNSNPGGSSSVLLVARVIEPGSLVVQAAQGSSANFGDVAINTSVTRSFVLANPGGEASGRITIGTSDARFSPSAGNCNPAGGGGLVDGSSCTFNVTFTPNSSETLSASLTASSPGAGDTALSITGRGRNAARLTGSNDFNFNTVIRGQSAAARTWTVTNAGDLTSGNIVTTGGNNEFTVTSNTCTARTLSGAQTCTMLVGFTPQGNGNRNGSITVSDGTSSVTLTVRGVGQPLPAVGAACLDGRCANTASCENHSNGQSLVCCAQNCTGNQRCSEDDDFESCELPTVGQGQGCGASVLCDTGLTCNGTNQTCCVSSCTGACRQCNLNGTCSNIADGQRGGCAANQVCAGGVCGNCTPGQRQCNPNNGRVVQVCSATGVFQDQTPACQFVCSGGFCGGDCVPNDLRCDPQTGRPQICSSAGTWTNNGPACGAASCEDGVCVCGPNQSLCSDGTTVTCSNDVFGGFEGGSLQGWAARSLGTGLGACGDAFSSCLTGFDVSNASGAARTGQFFASARFLMSSVSANRRVAVDAKLCGARGSGSLSTTNLAGKTISAYISAGSQGGSFAGNLYGIAISDGVATPTIIGTTDASTTSSGGQSTGYRLVSAVVPNNAIGRAVMFVYLSLEMPTQNSITSFQVDDIQITD